MSLFTQNQLYNHNVNTQSPARIVYLKVRDTGVRFSGLGSRKFLSKQYPGNSNPNM